MHTKFVAQRFRLSAVQKVPASNQRQSAVEASVSCFLYHFERRLLWAVIWGLLRRPTQSPVFSIEYDLYGRKTKVLFLLPEFLMNGRPLHQYSLPAVTTQKRFILVTRQSVVTGGDQYQVFLWHTG